MADSVEAADSEGVASEGALVADSKDSANNRSLRNKERITTNF